MPMMFPIQTKMFQSTYLYKVRRFRERFRIGGTLFQSTYLYKVRQSLPEPVTRSTTALFQSTYLYKVRQSADPSPSNRRVSIHVPI